MEPNGTREPGNSRHVEWEADLNDGETYEIKITYSIATKTVKQKMSSSDSGTVNDIPNEYIDDYIPESRDEDGETAVNGQEMWNSDRGEWTIDPTLPQIQEKAAEIQRGKVKVYDIVKATYDWVTSTWSYSTEGSGLKTCSQMLNSESGDCDDQSVVMISVLRAMGIPAWLELGVLYNKQANSWNGHGWANALIPKKDGTPVEAQIDVVNFQFMFRDPWRFTEYKDDGNGEALQEYYYVFTYTGGMGSFETKFRTNSYDDDGEVWLDKQSTPFIGPEVIVVAVAVTLFVYRRRQSVPDLR
jgi:hypothetical protein